MLDGIARRLIDPGLNRLGKRLADAGCNANVVSLGGAACALFCGLAIAQGSMAVALGMLAASRICDGLDGAIARHAGATDFGGFFDIVCDFAFYAAVPVGFAINDGFHAVAATVLLATFYINAATFLGFAVLAERRKMTTEQRGKKSLYFTTGLAEGTETIAVFIAMLLWPAAFAWLAYAFSLLCLTTSVARIASAYAIFGADVRK